MCEGQMRANRRVSKVEMLTDAERDHVSTNPDKTKKKVTPK